MAAVLTSADPGFGRWSGHARIGTQITRSRTIRDGHVGEQGCRSGGYSRTGRGPAAVTGLAVAIGPFSGGLLLRHFPWRSVFFVSVPIAVIALVAGAFLLPESRDPRAGRFDPAGTVLSVAGAGLLVSVL